MASADGGSILSLNERAFIRKSAVEGYRIDGRSRYDAREFRIRILNSEEELLRQLEIQRREAEEEDDDDDEEEEEGEEEKTEQKESAGGKRTTTTTTTTKKSQEEEEAEKPEKLSLPSNSNGSVVVLVELGGTKVVTSVSCTEVEPEAGRPTEGFYTFDTQLSPLASESALRGTTAQKARLLEAGRIIEKSLRNGKAIDTEALCLVAHEKVHSVRVDTRVLDDGGNVAAAASLGAIVGLKMFRRPTFTVSSSQAAYSAPLPLHHLPFVVTFALFEGNYLVLDPSWKEEQVADGYLTLAVNKYGEICNLQKAGGVSLEPALLSQCAQIAATQAIEITEKILALLPDE